MKIMSQKAMTLRYAAALSFIAVLSLCSDLIIVNVISTHKNSAEIINISGRQRMLSQRIASLAQQYQDGDSAAQDDLIAATDEFEANFTMLSTNPEAVSLFAKDQALRALYRDGPGALDKMEPGYVRMSRTIAATTPGDPSIAPQMTALLAEARGPLLDKLNTATLAYVRIRHHALMTMVKIQTASLLLVLLTLALEALFIFRPMIKRITAYTEELRHLSAVDPLTQVHTRRGFLSRCDVELKRVERYEASACLLLVGIDNFNAFSVMQGHVGGDKVLAALGPVLLQSCRVGDIVGHWDEAHFIVLLPLSDATQGRILAQTFQENVARLNMKLPKSLDPVTISIGITLVPHDNQNLNTAIARADGALFQAERAGRSQIEIAA